MLDLPQKTLSKIKRVLLRQQKQIKQQLDTIEKNDPVTSTALAPEAGESGTDSWLAETHGRLTAVKDNLLRLSGNVTRSLLKLKRGTYGKCENCKKPIEPARLEAMPTATLCLSCSKKTSKK